MSEFPAFLYFQNMELKITKINFIPFQDINSKGFLGFVNLALGTEEKDLLTLNSFGVYTRLDAPRHINLTMPAKRTGAGYKFYFRIEDEKLKNQIIKAIEDEIERLKLFDFKKIEKNELFEKNEEIKNKQN